MGKCLAREVFFQKPDTDKDAALPAHPGAAAFIDGTERTFLDRYSDYIWFTFLFLSGLGSGGAWLRYYLKREQREENLLHRNKLLLTIAKVHQANSLQELTAMQCEVEELIRETLAYADGAIEQGDLSALSLILEQFHLAVLERMFAIGATMPIILVCVPDRPRLSGGRQRPMTEHSHQSRLVGSSNKRRRTGAFLLCPRTRYNDRHAMDRLHDAGGQELSLSQSWLASAETAASPARCW